MKALTVKNPWAVFIALGWKLIENRGWAPPKLMVGKRIAIHAGAGKLGLMDEEELDDLLRGELVESYRLNAARLGLPGSIAGFRELWEATRGRVVAEATIKAVHTSAEAVQKDQRVWWVGEHAWELSELQRVNGPVVKGALGLWELPVDYKTEVLRG